MMFSNKPSLRSLCLHDQKGSASDGVSAESWHKPKVIAATFGVVETTIANRILSDKLPHTRHGRWVFVSDSDLREWVFRGVTFGVDLHAVWLLKSSAVAIGSASSSPPGKLLLSCGHLVENVAPPRVSGRSERPAAVTVTVTRPLKTSCRHDLKPALHMVRIIAKTYGVTEPAVFARIRTHELPVSRLDGMHDGALPRGGQGIPVYVSDADFRIWVGLGMRFGDGAVIHDPDGVRRAYNHEARTFQLACGHVVQEIRQPDGIAIRRRRLVKCRHDYESGPIHSIEAIAATVGKSTDDVFIRVKGEKIRIGTKVYASDAVIRNTFGPIERIACGWVLR